MLEYKRSTMANMLIHFPVVYPRRSGIVIFKGLSFYSISGNYYVLNIFA